MRETETEKLVRLLMTQNQELKKRIEEKDQLLKMALKRVQELISLIDESHRIIEQIKTTL